MEFVIWKLYREEDERLADFELKDFNSLYEVCIALFGKGKTFFLKEFLNFYKFSLKAEDLARYLVTNSGNLTTYNRLKKIIELGINTVIKYLSYLENA